MFVYSVPKVQQMKKQKEELQAKRDELKTSKKARAMASRTKDNFHGYNGVPVVDKPKKRGSKGDGGEDNNETGDAYDDDEDNYEYAGTDSETEEEQVPERPAPKALVSNKHVSKPVTKKPGGPAKGASQPMKFDEILKLAAKKQHEPVELKPVPKKSEERPRSAEDLRELEIQRKIKERRQQEKARQDSRSDPKSKAQHNSSSHRKSAPEKDSRGGGKPQKTNLPEKSSSSSGEVSRKPKPHGSGERPHGSTKPSHSDRPKSTLSSSGSSSSSSSKALTKAGSQVSAKQSAARSITSQRPNNATSDLNPRKGNHPSSGKPSSSGTRPPSGPSQGAQRSSSVQSRPAQSRPGQGSLDRVSSAQAGRGELQRRGGSHGGGAPRPSSNGQMRPVSSGATGKMGGAAQQRPGGSSLGRPGGGGGRPGPPGGIPGKAGIGPSGPGRPKCTVVSETISSKNVMPKPGMASRLVAPPRPGGPPRPGMPPRQGIPARPYGHGPVRPPGKCYNYNLVMFQH